MPGVTKEQIARAKEWDLLSYLQRYEPGELKKCGAAEYCTKSHNRDVVAFLASSFLLWRFSLCSNIRKLDYRMR